MNSDLFLAILAMDAYNRVPLPADSAILLPSTLGLAQVETNRPGPLGFFAQSYSWNGGKVISYRGTDGALDVIAWQQFASVLGTSQRQKQPPPLTSTTPA